MHAGALLCCAASWLVLCSGLRGEAAWVFLGQSSKLLLRCKLSKLQTFGQCVWMELSIPRAALFLLRVLSCLSLTVLLLNFVLNFYWKYFLPPPICQDKARRAPRARVLSCALGSYKWARLNPCTCFGATSQCWHFPDLTATVEKVLIMHLHSDFNDASLCPALPAFCKRQI